MVKDGKVIDETGAVYRHKETFILDDYGYAVSFEVEATVFETGDAHAIVDDEIEELYFRGDIFFDDIVNATWNRVSEITREKYETIMNNYEQENN